MLRKCLYQNEIMELIEKSFQRGILSHSILLQGETGSGKSTMALYIAALTHCKSENKPCFKCEECLKIRNLTHPAVIFLNTDDVNEKLNALETLIEKFGINQSLIEELVFVVRDVKFRVESEYLKNKGMTNKKIKLDMEKSLEKIDDILSTGNENLVKKKSVKILINNARNLAKQIRIENIPARTIRDLMSKVYKSNFTGKITIIITGIHKMKKEGANSFLKTLEEPPKDTRFILCTEKPDSILSTIKSRCYSFRFHGINNENIKKIAIANWNINIEETDNKGGILQRITKQSVFSSSLIINSVINNLAENLFPFVEDAINQGRFDDIVYELSSAFGHGNELLKGNNISIRDKSDFLKRANEIVSFVHNNNAEKSFALETILIEFHRLWTKK